MQNKNKVPLGEIAEIRTGRSLPKNKDRFWDGSIPRVKGHDLNSSYIEETVNSITQEGLEETGIGLVPEKSIILVARGPVGKVSLTKTKLSISQDLKAVVPDTEKVDPSYLLYFLESKRERLEDLASGSSLQSLSNQEIKQLEIELPSKKDQEKIAEVMTEIELLKQKSQERIEKLRHLKSVASEIMLQNQPNDCSLESLKEVADVKMGRTPKSDKINEQMQGTPYVQDENDLGFRYPDPHRATKKSSIEAHPGFVLMLVRGGDIGKVNIADREFAVGRGIANIEPKTVDTEYLYHFLEYKKDRIRQFSEVGSTKWIRKSELEKINVAIPPKSEQRNIVEVLDSIDETMMIDKKQIETLSELKTTVFSRLLHSPNILERLESVNGGEEA